MFTNGQMVQDKVSGEMLIVVEDRDTRVLVTGTSALKADATLIERAQWVLPADDLVAV